MNIAFLATGNEILSGDTLNSNCHQLSSILFSEGFSPGLQLACSDMETDIQDCIQFLTKKHNLIIMTGGLGPTSDDRTRFALAKLLQIDLVEHDSAIQHIEQRLKRAQLNMGNGNRQQAMFPEHAILLPNPYGTAMGAYFTHQQITYFLLPGPPRECLPMFEKYVLPVLNQNVKEDLVTLKWRLFGVAESEIATKLDQALADVDCETGYRLEVPYVEFKVRCCSKQIALVKQLIDPITEPLIISPPEKRASQILKEKMAEAVVKTVVIDKATGGMLQRSVLSRANHQQISFNEAKDAAFRFEVSGLDDYWNAKESSITKLVIRYQYLEKQGQEIIDIPFRSSLVLDYAAEWLSFRIAHLIDELHQ